MTVYCVMEHVEWEGSFLMSIWSTRELADVEITRLDDKHNAVRTDSRCFDVDEYVVDSPEEAQL